MPTSIQNVKKRSLIATAAILASRFFGLIREQIFAFLFGASFVNDAFLVAFRLPNLFRNLLAEGALSQTFTTVFAQKQFTQKQSDDANDLADQVMTLTFFIVGGLTLLGIIFSPQWIALIAPGFTDEKLTLTITLNRILFPFILFAALAALSMGMLNAKNKFFLPQSASTFFNITVIITGIVVHIYFQQSPLLSIQIMATGFLMGGIMQWIIQLPTLSQLGYRLRFNCNFKNKELKKTLMLVLPAILGAAAVQINVIVNTYFASELPTGSISYLSYAFRLMQFPLGAFGVAIATAAAPSLARLSIENRSDELKTTLQSSFQMSLFLSVPSTVGLIVLAHPIVALIFQHGHFTAHDTTATAHALQAYALGIASYSLIKIYQPAFLAFHDAKTPMKIALSSIFLNFSLGFLFIRIFHGPYWTLSLVTACVAAFDLALLVVFFRRKIPGIWNRKQKINLIKTVCASLGMGCVAFGVNRILSPHFDVQTMIGKINLALLPIFVATLFYFGVSVILKIDDAEIIRNKFLKTPE